MNLKDFSGSAARLITGSAFLIAGIEKALVSHDILIWILKGLGLPTFAAFPAAWIFPFCQIFFGLFLICGLYTRVCVLFFSAAAALEEIILLQAWLRMVPVAELDFYGIFLSHSIIWQIFQNVLLILILYPAFFYGSRYTLDNLIKSTLTENKNE